MRVGRKIEGKKYIYHFSGFKHKEKAANKWNPLTTKVVKRLKRK